MIAIVTSDQFTVGLIAKHRSSFIARTVMIHELPLASAHGTSLPCLGHNMKLIALVEDPALSSFLKPTGNGCIQLLLPAQKLRLIMA